LWPVRLLRDGVWEERGDVELLVRLSGHALEHERLEKRISLADSDSGSCVVAMLVVHEACRRVQLTRQKPSQAATECMTHLQRCESELRQPAHTILTALFHGLSGAGNLIAACRGAWESRIDLDDIACMVNPVWKEDGSYRISTYNMEHTNCKFFARKSDWIKMDDLNRSSNGTTSKSKAVAARSAGASTRVANMKDLKCAVDRYLVDVAQSTGIPADEARLRLHNDLSLA
jgi:hypothetical protein